MYQIIKNGEVIAAQAGLQWVKKQENGIFVRSSAEEGQGILVGDTIYIVRGKPAMDGRETVDIVEVQDTAAPGGDGRVKDVEEQLAAITGAVERGLA